MKVWAKSTAIAGLLILVQGCETVRVGKTFDRIDDNANKASALAEGMRNGDTSPSLSGAFTDKQWVDVRPMPIKVAIPAAKDCSIMLSKNMGIYEFAKLISDECQVEVNIAPDVFDRGLGNNPQSVGTAALPGSAGEGPSLADYYPGGNGSGQAGYSSGGAGHGSTYIRGFEYSGKLSTLLDQVTAQLGVSWRYNQNDGSISVFYLDTRTYNFFAFADKNTMTSKVESGASTSSGASGSGGSSGGSSSGGVTGLSGSNQSTTVNLETSIVEDVEANVKAMLSPVGKMAMSKSTGMLTITDRPAILDRISTYIDAENKNVTKQILLNVEVYSVTLKDADAVGIDWNLVYKSTNGKWGASLVNKFSGTPESAVAGTINVLNGNFKDSRAVVDALSEQGNVSTIISPSVTTLNLQPVPILVGRQTTYLASVQTTNTANVGSSSSLTPGNVTSGFNMDLLPFVMSGDELLLKYSISISSLIKLRKETSGENSIEMPEIDSRIFSQKVKMKSGETLVLSGFDQVKESGALAGTGTPWNFLLGGGANRETTRDVIVVMITPILKD